MIRYRSHKQLTLSGFDTPFETALDKHNRWIKLGECIPWDELAFPSVHWALNHYRMVEGEKTFPAFSTPPTE